MGPQMARPGEQTSRKRRKERGRRRKAKKSPTHAAAHGSGLTQSVKQSVEPNSNKRDRLRIAKNKLAKLFSRFFGSRCFVPPFFPLPSAGSILLPSRAHLLLVTLLGSFLSSETKEPGDSTTRVRLFCVLAPLPNSVTHRRVTIRVFSSRFDVSTGFNEKEKRKRIR